MWKITLIFAVYFAVSWLSAWIVGKSWVESKAVGGWIRLVAWAGAVKAACGFTVVYLGLLGGGLYATGLIDDSIVDLVLSLGYLLVVPPFLMAGSIITIESWRLWYRHRSLLSLAAAEWNVYADLHNAMQVMDTLPSVAGHVGSMIGKAFNGDGDTDSKDSGKALTKAAVVLAFLIVTVAVLAGVLTTVVLVKRYAATDPIVRYPEGEAVRA